MTNGKEKKKEEEKEIRYIALKAGVLDLILECLLKKRAELLRRLA